MSDIDIFKEYNIPRDAVITIAGTVGVGKSTLTKTLADKLNFMTSYEKVVGNPYLEKYYHDFERWSFHLQVFFLAERFKEQKRLFQYGGGFVQDRSIYEDVEIFAKMNFDKGTMSPNDYETYRSLFEAMVMTPFFPHPDLVIYVEGDFDEIIKRIEERGRQMEIDTDVAYWRELYQRYEDWIRDFNHAPVLRINIRDYDLVNDPESVDIVLRKIGKVLGHRVMKSE